MLNINWPPFTQFRCVQHAVHRLFSGFKIKVRNHTKSPELQLLFLNTYFYRWALSFLISVICFPLALNNLSVILLTEFTFLLGFSQCFASSSSQRDEGNKGGERKWGKQNWRAEELRSWFSIYTIPCISNYQLCMKSLFVSSILPLFTISVLFSRIFTKTTFTWGPGSVVQLSTITNHRSDSIQKNAVMLFYLSSSLHLCIPNRMTKKSTTVLMGKAIQIDGIQIEDFFGRSYHS